MQRRGFVEGSAVAAAAGLGGCAAPGAQAQRTLFNVPATTIPIVACEMHIDGLPNLNVKIV